MSRIPGDKRSAICAQTDTNAHGSDISNQVAQAFLAMSQEAEIAIQNAGGVRTDIATDYHHRQCLYPVAVCQHLTNLR